MATIVNPNTYGFYTVEQNADQIDYTNPTTRTLLQGEMVVAVDANDNAYIGVVAEVDGIAESATGKIALCEGNVIMTNQVAESQTFVAKVTNVYVAPQTNSAAASLYVASAATRFELKAFVTEVDNTAGWVKLRMPHQDGNLIAITYDDEQTGRDAFNALGEMQKMQIIEQHEGVEQVWLSLVYPIINENKTEALLVLDISESHGEHLNNFNSPLMVVVWMMQVFLIFSLFLLVFLAYRYYKIRKELIIDNLTSVYKKQYLYFKEKYENSLK